MFLGSAISLSIHSLSYILKKNSRVLIFIAYLIRKRRMIDVTSDRVLISHQKNSRKTV